jgi:chromosome segregation ATPase
MKIFDSIKFSDNKKNENLLLLYEQKIEERKKELSQLDNLLRSKRFEISKILEEKKLTTNETQEIRSEKIKLERELDSIKENLEMLHMMETQEKEVALSINSQISRLKNEATEKYLLQNDIDQMKFEYDTLTMQITESQNKLKALNQEEDYLAQVKKEIGLSIEKFHNLEDEISLTNEKLIMMQEKEKNIRDKGFKQFYKNLGLNKINNTGKISLTKKTKSSQRCAAITKKGERCCRKSLPKSKYCTIHTK